MRVIRPIPSLPQWYPWCYCEMRVAWRPVCTPTPPSSAQMYTHVHTHTHMRAHTHTRARVHPHAWVSSLHSGSARQRETERRASLLVQETEQGRRGSEHPRKQPAGHLGPKVTLASFSRLRQILVTIRLFSLPSPTRLSDDCSCESAFLSIFPLS